MEWHVTKCQNGYLINYGHFSNGMSKMWVAATVEELANIIQTLAEETTETGPTPEVFPSRTDSSWSSPTIALDRPVAGSVPSSNRINF